MPKPDDYLTPEQTAELLAKGAEARRKRLGAADLLTTAEAAELAGVTHKTVINWIDKGRAIGLSQTKRGFKLPRWQFDQPLWDVLPKLSLALGTGEGWFILAFLETPHGGLDGRSPLQAIEQGDAERVLLLAQHNGES